MPELKNRFKLSRVFSVFGCLFFLFLLSIPVLSQAASCSFLSDITANINGIAVAGNTAGHADDYLESGNSGLGPDDLYSFTLSSPANVTISLCGRASWDTYIYLRTDCNDPGTTLATNDDFCSASGPSQITKALGPGTYYLVIDGYNGASGAYSFLITAVSGCPTVADVTANINGAPVTGDTTGATDDFQVYGTYAVAPDDLYKFTIGSNVNVTVSLCGQAAWDTIIYLRTNCYDDNTTLVADDDSCATLGASEFTYPLGPGTYYLVIDGYSGAAGPYSFTITANPAPTPMPTPTPACPSGFYYGKTFVGAYPVDDSGYFDSYKYVLSAPGTITRMSIYLESVNNPRAYLGVYTDGGTQPGTRITQGGPIVLSQGWNTVAMSPPTVLAAGTYWLALNIEDLAGGTEDLFFDYGPTNSEYYKTSSFVALPNNAPNLGTNADANFSFYAHICPVPPTQTPTFTRTISPTRTQTATNTPTLTMTLTPSPTPTCSSPMNFGNSHAGDFQWAAEPSLNSTKFILAQTGVVSGMRLIVTNNGGGGKSIRAAIYDGSGSPGNLVAETVVMTAAVGTNVLSFTVPPVLSPGTYWLAWQADPGVQVAHDIGTSGDEAYRSLFPFGSFPASYNSTASGAWKWSIFAVYCPISGAAPTPTQTPACAETIVGNNLSVGGSIFVWPSDQNSVNSSRYFLSTGGWLTRMFLRCTTYSGQVRVAVYSDNAGVPQTRLVESASVQAVQGWTEVDVPDTYLAGGTTYWLAFQAQSGVSVEFAVGSSGDESYRAPFSYGAFPAAFARTGTGTNRWAIVGFICPGAAPTATATSTFTLTQSPTSSATSTSTLTQSPTSSATSTSTLTQSPTSSATSTATLTQSPTSSSTSTATLTQSPTPSSTSTSTLTQSPTSSATSTSTLTQSPTPSSTSTATLTQSPTSSSTSTSTLTQSPTSTSTSTSSLTPSPTPSSTATSSMTLSPTSSPTSTSSMTSTATSSLSPTRTSTNTPVPFTPSSTSTFSLTPTLPQTSTSTRTLTQTFTATASLTMTPSSTASATASATSSLTATPTSSPTPTQTSTQSLTATASLTASPTSTDTRTPTSSSTLTATRTDTATRTPTVTATDTVTPLPPGTLTATPTPDAFLVLDSNTFNPLTQPSLGMDVMMGTSGRCKVTVYNFLGEKVQELMNVPSQPAGNTRAYWNGKNTQGAVVGNAVYLVVIETPGGKLVKKVIVLK